MVPETEVMWIIGSQENIEAGRHRIRTVSESIYTESQVESTNIKTTDMVWGRL